MRLEACKTYFRGFCNAALLAIVAYSAVWEIRILCHDLLMTSQNDGTRQIARRLSPYDPAGISKVTARDRDVRITELARTVDLNPRDTRTSLQLSYEYETSGREAAAEKLLESAEHYDAGPGPKWALANFYLRKNDVDQFFYWTNRYRAVAAEPSPALMRLAAGASGDLNELLRRMGPMACSELAQLLDIADDRGWSPTAILTPVATCGDAPSIQSKGRHISRLLERDQPSLAEAQWKQFGLTDNLFNANFSNKISEQGFDWYINRSAGVLISQQSGGPGLRIDLQPEAASHSVLVYQPVLLEADHAYKLSVQFSDQNAMNRSLQPELVELVARRVLPSAFTEENDNEEGQVRSWMFRAPKTAHTVVLAFLYTDTGQQITGDETLLIGSVHLEAVGQ